MTVQEIEELRPRINIKLDDGNNKPSVLPNEDGSEVDPVTRPVLYWIRNLKTKRHATRNTITKKVFWSKNILAFIELHEFSFRHDNINRWA